jgi:thiamine biosynthesis lipoprotein
MNSSAVGRDTFEVFGTTAVLLLTDPGAMRRARVIADRILADVDLACSRFRPDSELVRLNAAGGEPVAISATFAELLAAALRAAKLTGGDVNPTCARALIGLGYNRDFAEVKAAADAGPRLTGAVGPLPSWRSVHLDRSARRAWLDHGTQIDLGATAKAWAADRCATQLADTLRCGVLVSLGGDVAVAGRPPPEHWSIKVTDDHAAPPESAPGQTITISSGGLATSSTTLRTWMAGGRRVHHIIDPATGEPARSCWRTVSVAAGTCTDANIASTAAIIRSVAAVGWLHDLGLPARLVREDGTVQTTAGWPTDVPPDAA